MTVTLIGKSQDRQGGWTTLNAAAHPGAAAGDWQVAAWQSHSSITPPTFPAGWTLLSTTQNLHLKISILKRLVTEANKGTGFLVPAVSTYGACLMRTYRGATDIEIAGQGNSLTSPGRDVEGLLLRIMSDSEDNNASFPPDKKLIPDAALLGTTDDIYQSYTWFNGLIAGDDPTESGSTAPIRVTQNLLLNNGQPSPAKFPRYTDIMVKAPIPPPEAPYNLHQSGATNNSADVEWVPPLSGTQVASFEYSIDNNDPVDVGMDTSLTLTGLGQGEHPLEVWSVSPSGVRSTVPASLDVAPLVPEGVKWDDPDKRLFQTGCSHGVIYLEDGKAVAWNGLTGVDENGTGTSSVLYRDGTIYYADVEPGDYSAQVKAFFWPDEFSKTLGIPEVGEGLYVDNQKPRRFNFSYQNLVGSGGKGDRFGRQIHLIYNAIANLGTRSRKTRTASITLDEFTFDINAVPVKLPGMRPSAHYIIDTRNMDASTLKTIETILYVEGRMPHPTELYDLMNFGDAITFVDNLDGTWTARGSRDNLIDHKNGTWTIKNVNGVDHGDGTFTLEDTIP